MAALATTKKPPLPRGEGRGEGEPRFTTGGTIIATGAWLKNRAVALAADGARCSPLHGDLATPEACTQLRASLADLIANARTPVIAIAHDLHPDFYSTQLAIDLADQLGVPAIAVQHHHAHIGVVVAEHGLDRPVIGLALDGVGLGTDGTPWGGELLWVHHAQWRRLGHLSPLAMPGGDRAAREPWRMASAALHALGRADQIEDRFSNEIGAVPARAIHHLLSKQVQCPATTSAGRWFDAAAAALGLVLKQDDEAQAAMALERCATQWLAARGNHAQALIQPELLRGMLTSPGIDMRPLLARLFDAPADERERSAALFHVHLAEALCQWAAQAAQAHGVQDVCLSGGCFFNQILRTRVAGGLTARGLRAHLPLAHSCGDAGLALGQAWVAAHVLRDERAAAPPKELLCV